MSVLVGNHLFEIKKSGIKSAIPYVIWESVMILSRVGSLHFVAKEWWCGGREHLQCAVHTPQNEINASAGHAATSAQSDVV